MAIPADHVLVTSDECYYRVAVPAVRLVDGQALLAGDFTPDQVADFLLAGNLIQTGVDKLDGTPVASVYSFEDALICALRAPGQAALSLALRTLANDPSTGGPAIGERLRGLVKRAAAALLTDMREERALAAQVRELDGGAP